LKFDFSFALCDPDFRQGNKPTIKTINKYHKTYHMEFKIATRVLTQENVDLT